MKTREYSEAIVVKQLNMKHDLNVNMNTKTVQELKTFPARVQGAMSAKGDVGIKSKGKIAYLQNYHDYQHFHVDKF